jgi:hypothetical protein
MFAPENVKRHAELLKTAEAKVALDPSALKMLLAGGAAVGAPTYLYTHARDEREKERARNRSFGAGMATGLAGPQVLRGVLNIARRQGFLEPPQEAGS